MPSRSEAKADTRRKLLDAARNAVREEGASSLSLRDVARRAGIVPSAVYRHFESRDALLTQLILDAYTGLAEHLDAEGDVGESPERGQEADQEADQGERWREAANELRRWALGNRHEFQLIYGTPVPGYQAPQETIAAAARVAAVFIGCLPGEDKGDEHGISGVAVGGQINEQLTQQLAGPAADFEVSAEQLAMVLARLAHLVGVLVLELGGHFVGTADPADHLWDAIVDGQVG